jgi:hypothetical protein
MPQFPLGAVTAPVIVLSQLVRAVYRPDLFLNTGATFVRAQLRLKMSTTPWWERKEAEIQAERGADAACSVSSSTTVRVIPSATPRFPVFPLPRIWDTTLTTLPTHLLVPFECSTRAAPLPMRTA